MNDKNQPSFKYDQLNGLEHFIKMILSTITEQKALKKHNNNRAAQRQKQDDK